MRTHVSLGFLLVLMFGGCGPSKDDLLQKLENVRQKAKTIELQSGSDDEHVKSLIAQCDKEMETVQDLIIENEYGKAMRILDKVSRDLDQFQTRPKESERVRPSDREAQVFGKVEIRKIGGAGFERMPNNVKPGEIEVLRTDIRSGVVLHLFNETQLVLPAQSEIALEGYDDARRRLRIQLNKGTLFLKKEGGSRIVLTMEGFRAESEGRAETELTHEVLTGHRYMVVADGDFSWQFGDKKGGLGRNQGLLWRDGDVQLIVTPSRPKIDAPEHQATIEPAEGETIVPFRWHTAVHVPEFQLQVSHHPEFVTRVLDRTNLKNGAFDGPLPRGSYYWRVRGFSPEGVPGPYSISSMFTIEKGEGNAAKAAPSVGPPIAGVNIEIINTMVIISGRTAPEAKVNVNGVTAVMMDGGRFRAILNFLEEGSHDLRIVATDGTTAAETVEERKIRIQF